MLKARCRLTLIAAIGTILAGCAATNERPGSPDNFATVVDAVPNMPHATGDLQKINDLERQLVREQRQCVLEKRRLELSLKESQKQSDDLQKNWMPCSPSTRTCVAGADIADCRDQRRGKLSMHSPTTG
ncbi:hypothetical protein [Dechloromonas sp. HYN0024]|uniref:hypothetical protein n=1 Tax=Dechloromonas sp. HYN0024 TaxID=2231055 RepID=UPI0013C34F04|nr:hypothetical protein [Dechloromonas sp. HYN0024]